ncbi:hypothetical protein FB45DRAFT_420687 [Roridomyces roridus]|uniref:Uncharacterized protein n=1 Tax=Roridomyces roridus TaxID=1738132 RepID=A0AAD7FRJ3_9AGAR|nr:hypothetical protein FB45DRAFT_420687 [Roridomyces roridus]
MSDSDSECDSIYIQFEGCPQPFTAYTWSIPDFAGLFHTLPLEFIRLVIPKEESLFTNGQGDKRRIRVRLDDAKYWGLDGEEGSVIFARASEDYCIRFIFNATHVVRCKESPSYEAFQRLVADAEFHSHHLDLVEGKIAPRHYGMWLMNTGHWAGKVILSISDYCGVSWNELRFTKFNTEANRLRIGHTFEVLHNVGISHSGFSLMEEFRHVLIDIHAPGLSPEDALNGIARCYIADFSSATIHICPRTLPIVTLDARPTLQQVGCFETRQLLYLLKFLPKTKVDETTVVGQALQWYHDYSTKYPGEDNIYLMMAQRARNFPHLEQVHPNVCIEFKTDSRLCYMDLTVLTHNDDEQTPGASNQPAETTAEDATADQFERMGLDDPAA